MGMDLMGGGAKRNTHRMRKNKTKRNTLEKDLQLV